MSLMFIFTIIASIIAIIISITAYKKKEPKYLLALAFILIWLYFMGSSYYQTEKHRNILKNLKAEEIISLSIGKTLISDQSKIKDIVESLKNNKTYTSSNRDVGKTFLFKINFKNKKHIYFNIAYLSKSQGIILRFVKIYENGYRSYGDAFSSTLNDTLLKAGIDFKKMSEIKK